MQKLVDRLLKSLELLVIGSFSLLAAATVVALRHMIETPQPLESPLPGKAHIYRWKRGHIFYKEIGSEEAPALVLLHGPGIGASAYEMREITRPLAPTYHIYAPDLLGFGLSDRPRVDYSAEMYIALCHDFLSEVVGRPATLLASGLSCNYAVALAARFPELCERLVLLSPVELFASQRQPLQRLVRAPLLGSLLYPLISTRIALRYIIRHAHPDQQDQDPKADLDHLFATTHQFGAQYAPLALIAGDLEINVSQQFEKLQQPAFIIWGAAALNKAPYITSRYHVSAHTQVALVRDAGVRVHEENPETVVANVLAWSQEGENEPAPQSGISEFVSQPPESSVPGIEEPVSGQVEVSESEPSAASLEAYCVKCKKKTVMQDVQEVTMKNGRPAAQGRCAVCGTRLFRIGRLSKE